MIDLWIWKIRIWLKWIYFKDFFRRNIHCRFGYHKVRGLNRTTINHYKEKLEVSYLDCPVCNTYFFRNEADKKIWKRIIESRNAQMSNTLKLMVDSEK